MPVMLKVSEAAMITRAALIGATVLLVAGCNAPPSSNVGALSMETEVVSQRQVTLYLAGMNQKLQIL